MKSDKSQTKKESYVFRKLNFLEKIVIYLTITGKWILKTWEKIYPRPQFRKGAAWGAILFTFITAIAIGIYIRPGFWIGIDIPAGILLTALLFMGVAFSIGLVLKIVSIFPKFINWGGLMALGCLIAILVLFHFPFLAALGIGIIAISIEAVLGGLIATAFGKDFKYTDWVKKIVTILGILAIIGLNIWLVNWVTDEGSDIHLVNLKAPANRKPISLPDLSKPGPYIPLKLTYGSQLDERRPEFSKEADLKTKSVDASPFLKGNKGIKMKIRQMYWGFGPKNFPLNGLIWYPTGKGPFPLILIVHGNHKMEKPSHSGFAYLGRCLASLGFIAVSIDENFFNTSWTGPLKNENDGRGWLILEHLKVWKEWNTTDGNPFFGKVDMNNIGLVGHSSGGEAVVIAAMFNHLERYPEDASIKFDYHFNIRSIVAIAPCENQYVSDNRPISLKNINYLLLQGAHDARVFSLFGARQYRRLRFSDGQYWFKTSLVSYRSNHNQFNSAWGENDYNFPLKLFLNKKPILKGSDQRKISSITISAFFEATLNRKITYIPLFRDHRLAAKWIPEDIYINRFEDSTCQMLCNYEEDIDVTTGTYKGTQIEGNHLSLWKEGDIKLRKHGTKQNQVVYIGWKKRGEDIPRYRIRLPESFQGNGTITNESILVFSLANATESHSEFKEGKKGGNSNKLLDLSVELATSNEKRTRLPLNHFMNIYPVLKSRFTIFRHDRLFFGNDYELTLQTYEIPISAFLKVSPDLDLASIQAIEFVFDRSPTGLIILDDIGLARTLPTEDQKPEPTPDQ